MKKAIVTTVLNEESSIGEFLDSLTRQSAKPTEVIICDGGSSDRTQEIIKEFGKKFPVKLVVKQGNRSVGRNAAITKATADVIAVTDAGTTLGPNWFAEITKPFTDPHIAAVSGFFKAAPETFFELVSSTLMLSDHDQIDPDTWLPSSRSVAFRKSVWEKVGGYPEAFDHNEDTPFDKAVLRAGYKFHFAPGAVVYWRPRGDLGGFLRQYYRYSRGDGEGLIDPRAYFKKILIYLFFLALILLTWPTGGVLFVAALYIVYLSKRLVRVYRRVRDWRVWPLGLLLSATVDVSAMLGYLRGAVDRVTERKFGQAYG